MSINSKTGEILQMVINDLNQHSDNWYGEVFTDEKSESLMELVEVLQSLLDQE